MIEVCVLKESICGVRKEINRRTWQMSALVEMYTGNEKRFFKPVKNKKAVIEKALKLRQEVKKLHLIKSDLQNIINQQPTRNDLSRTIKRPALAEA